MGCVGLCFCGGQGLRYAVPVGGGHLCAAGSVEAQVSEMCPLLCRQMAALRRMNCLGSDVKSGVGPRRLLFGTARAHRSGVFVHIFWFVEERGRVV